MSRPFFGEVRPGLKSATHFLRQLGFTGGRIGCKGEPDAVAGVDLRGAEELDLEGELVVPALAGEQRYAVEVAVETQEGVQPLVFRRG